MTDRRPTSHSRRRHLAGIATTLGFGFAGCSADGDRTGGTRAATNSPASTRSPEPTRTEPTDATAESTATGSPTATTDGSTPVHAGYDATEVRVVSDGETLGSVTAAIADTSDLRYLGLSDTESLPEDRGMLFVFDAVGDRTFVMRGMDFGIDIVYADGDGTITGIHHAPAPGPNEDGEEQGYPGRGQFVLEVNYGWTTERGVEAGDVLEFDR